MTRLSSPRTASRRPIATAALVFTCLASAAGADVVTDWNAIAVDAVASHRTNPPVATRNFALVHGAVYDAVNGIVGDHLPYLMSDAGPAGASLEAAAAAAAHHVLVAVYPDAKGSFDAELAASLAAVPEGPPKEDGIAWGVHCAEALLEARADDGAAALVDHYAPAGAGWWVPTPPGFAAGLVPQWARVKPWTMTHSSQFRVPAPPPLSSHEYAVAFEEVRRLGAADSPDRTADQSQIALFWNDGPGTGTPPGHWQWIARILAEQQGTGLVENARLFALLSFAQADAAIVSWDNKYYYNHWRPYTGIARAGSDGNPATPRHDGWSSYIPTPPFPTYTSGHSTFSGSSSRILASFFGTDAIPFQVGSDGIPGVERQYATISEAAEEAGQSRIYGGIHWQYDNTYGLSSGRAMADHLFYNFLRPRRAAAGICTADEQTLCLGGDRFAVTAEFRTEGGPRGAARALPINGGAGGFYFFAPENLELTVKVLDACGLTASHWLFASGMTNLEVLVTITDTWTGDTREVFNPLGKAFESVIDTRAFLACP